MPVGVARRRTYWTPPLVATPPIVFCQQNIHFSGQLCLVNFDGTGFTQLTSDANDYQWARWSKDGTQILAADSSNRLWIFTASGSLVRQLTLATSPAAGFWQGDWAPDDTQVVVTGHVYSFGTTGTCDLQIIQADNSAASAVTLTERMGLDYNSIISWSPDGTRFLYTGVTGTPGAVTSATSCLIDGSSPVDILAGVPGGPGRLVYLPWRWYSDSTNILVVESAGSGIPTDSLLKSDGTTTTTLYADPTNNTLNLAATLGAMDPTEALFAWNAATADGLEGLTGGTPSSFYSTSAFVNTDGIDWRP